MATLIEHLFYVLTSKAECRFEKGLQVLDSNVSYILFFRNAHRLTFTTLWDNSADDKLMIFFLFFTRKQNLTVHRKLSETIYLKCQIPFLGKIRKIVKKCRLLKKKIPRVLSG